MGIIAVTASGIHSPIAVKMAKTESRTEETACKITSLLTNLYNRRALRFNTLVAARRVERDLWVQSPSCYHYTKPPYCNTIETPASQDPGSCSMIIVLRKRKIRIINKQFSKINLAIRSNFISSRFRKSPISTKLLTFGINQITPYLQLWEVDQPSQTCNKSQDVYHPKLHQPYFRVLQQGALSARFPIHSDIWG